LNFVGKIVNMTKLINSFKDEYEEFSNFYPVKIRYETRTYNSVEIAYVAAKTKNQRIRYELSQLKANESGKAKKLGRQIKLRKDWDLMKNTIMRTLLRQKFSYPKLKEKLLETGDAELVEGNFWHDNYWGDCLCPKCYNIPGKNYLGKMLMEIRSTL